MDNKQIRQLLKEYETVVLVEEGHPPLVVREWKEQPREASEEVPISARWPKARAPMPAPQDMPDRQAGLPATRQDSVLERLNKEIVALKEQIEQEETQATGQDN